MSTHHQYVELAEDHLIEDQPILETSKEYKHLRIKDLKFENQHTLNEGHSDFKYPPDFRLSEIHYKATSVGLPSNSHDQPKNLYCPDSMLNLNNHPYPLFCSVDSLSKLGVGYPLYFVFLRFCMIVIGVIILFEALPTMIYYATGSTCKDGQFCPNDIALILSVGNRVEDYRSSKTFTYSRLISFFILIILFQLWRRKLRQLKVKYNEKLVSVSDYTVVLKGFPADFKGKDIDETIKEWLINEYNNDATYADKDKHLVVKQIVLCYQIEEFLKLKKELENLQIKEALKEPHDEARKNEIHDKVHQLEKEFHEGKSNKFVGVAYISFETQDMADRVLKKYRFKGEWKRTFAEMELTSYIKDHNFRVADLEHTLVYSERAYEPNDIVWNHYGVSYKKKLLGSVIANIINVAALIPSFLITYYLTDKSIDITLQTPEEAVTTIQYLYIELITSSISIAIVAISYVIIFLIMFTAEFCKFETYTQEDSFVASNCSKILFVNTAIVALLVSWFTHDYFSITGLLETMYYVFISNALLTPILNIFDWVWYLHLFKKWYILKKKPEEIKMPQQKLNKNYFLKPNFDYSYKIGCNLRYVSVGIFYCTVAPIGIFWSLLGLVLNYMTDKYVLVRRSNRMKVISAEIVEEMTEAVEFVIIYYALGCCLETYLVLDSFTFELKQIPFIYPFLVVIAVLHALLPMERVNKFLFTVDGEKYNDETYEQAKLKCDFDYDISNPALVEMSKAQELKERHMKKVEEKSELLERE